MEHFGQFNLTCCQDVMNFLYAEMARWENERFLAMEFAWIYESHIVENPFREMVLDDVNLYIAKVDIMINAAYDSISELRNRKEAYENRLREEENLEGDNIMDELEESGFLDQEASFTSDDEESLVSGFDSMGSIADRVNDFPDYAIDLLGGELAYFQLDEETLPKSLYGS